MYLVCVRLYNYDTSSKFLPDMNHRPFRSNRKSSADGRRTGKELDAERRQIEHVTHYGSVEKPDHFRYARAACRTIDELFRTRITNQCMHQSTTYDWELCNIVKGLIRIWTHWTTDSNVETDAAEELTSRSCPVTGQMSPLLLSDCVDIFTTNLFIFQNCSKTDLYNSG